MYLGLFFNVFNVLYKKIILYSRFRTRSSVIIYYIGSTGNSYFVTLKSIKIISFESHHGRLVKK